MAWSKSKRMPVCAFACCYWCCLLELSKRSWVALGSAVCASGFKWEEGGGDTCAGGNTTDPPILFLFLASVEAKLSCFPCNCELVGDTREFIVWSTFNELLRSMKYLLPPFYRWTRLLYWSPDIFEPLLRRLLTKASNWIGLFLCCNYYCCWPRCLVIWGRTRVPARFCDFFCDLSYVLRVDRISST